MEWYILGIEPTTDMKIIKKAYAEMAKRFNPEVYPDQFRQIHDAYKFACSYAAQHKEKKPFPGQTEAEDSDEYDFSAVGNDPVQEDENEFDFSGINDKSMRETLRYSDIRGDSRDENGSADDTYDFTYSDSDNDGSSGKSGEQEYDFSYMDDSLSGKEYKQTYSRAGSKKNTSSDERRTGYDFDYLDTETIKNVLAEITALVGDAANRSNTELWKKIFYSAAFKRSAANNDFRCQSRELIYGKMFTKETAEFIAESFGLGSFVIHVHYKPVHEYTVKITAKETRRRPDTKKLKIIADKLTGFSKLF